MLLEPLHRIDYGSRQRAHKDSYLALRQRRRHECRTGGGCFCLFTLLTLLACLFAWSVLLLLSMIYAAPTRCFSIFFILHSLYLSISVFSLSIFSRCFSILSISPFPIRSLILLPHPLIINRCLPFYSCYFISLIMPYSTSFKCAHL